MNGLTMVTRDYPISVQTMTRSKTHITGPTIGISQIPREDVEEEGGDTKEEIERFTSTPEGSKQPSSQAHARALDRLDHPLHRLSRCMVCYNLMCKTPWLSLPTSKARSLHFHLRLMTCWWSSSDSSKRALNPSSSSSSLFSHFDQKGGKFEGGAAQFKGEA